MGGEARPAEPPASGRNISSLIETVQAVWSEATKTKDTLQLPKVIFTIF
jgi:hypothetical protein